MSAREEDYLSQPEVQRRWIRLLCMGGIIQGIVLFLLLIWNIVQQVRTPSPELLALDSNLRVRQLVTSHDHKASEKEVMGWMITCSIDATSFSFDKFQREAARARECFEPSAWEEYFSKLEAADFYRVTKQRTNVSGAPSGYPSFVKEHVVSGNKAFEYEFPFVRTWEDKNGKEYQSHTAKAIIMQVDASVKPSGWQFIHFSLGAGQ